MWRGGLVACGLAVVLLLVFSGTAAAQTTGTDAETHVDIAVEADGDAVWTVTTEVLLEEESERRAFDRMDAEAAGADAAAMFKAFAERAENETGRSMSVEVKTTDKLRDGDRGVVRVEFVWDSFGTVDENDRVYVDDVFEGGLSLEDGQTVTLYAPDGYVVDATDTTATADERSVEWTGPVDVQEDVSVVFESNHTDDEGEGEGLPGFGAVAVVLAALTVSCARLR